MGRSAFFGSRAVHMVSASMSKVNRTGKPLGESGMTDLRDERLEGHGARARTLALEAGGEGQHTTVAVPGPDDLQSDGEPVGCDQPHGSESAGWPERLKGQR